MLKKWLNILSHLLFWGATTWFFISIFGIEQKEIRIINGEETVQVNYNSTIAGQLIWAILFSALLVYASTITILKYKGSKIKSFVLSFIYLILLLLLFILLRKLHFIPSSPLLSRPLIAGIFIFYYISGISYSILLLWLKTDRARLQMEGEKKEAELTLLRSQLHPHFLFNVLNGMLSMVDLAKNPELTKSIHLLSDLLRYVVSETNKGKVPIQKEIEFIKNYSSLQSLRFEKTELDFKLDIQGAFLDQYVEPGLFIPFIENAFKYGTEPEKVSSIMVGFDFPTKYLIKFSITNKIHEGLSYFEGTGFGIATVKKTLEMIYPNRHILKYGTGSDSTFTVNLELYTDESNNSRR